MLSIEQAWDTYEDVEAELWDEYAADPTFVAGRMYIAGEQLARRRRDRAVRRCRFQAEAFKAELAAA